MILLLESYSYSRFIGKEACQFTAPRSPGMVVPFKLSGRQALYSRTLN
jgi:hypothetical protein